MILMVVPPLLLFVTGPANTLQNVMETRPENGIFWLPRAVAGEIDAVGVVDDAIENSVGVGGIADQLVALVDRDLAGDDDGRFSLPAQLKSV
jgi:hypothetical protein